jgi:hypothetical protein
MNFLTGRIQSQDGEPVLDLARCVRSSTGILSVSPTGVSPVEERELQGRDGPATHGQDAHATTNRLLARQALHVPSRLAACLRDYRKETIIAGVRPHDLSLEPWSGATGDVLRGRIVLMEPLGSQTNMHMDLACGQSCVVVTPPRTHARIGDDVRVYVRPDGVLLFEADEAGRTIGSCILSE